MRIISFSKMWDKLKQPEFTTFRLSRADANKGQDWRAGEIVQVYYKSRTPERAKLGDAEIINKEPRCLDDITDEEARADGFSSWRDMYEWLGRAHKTHIDRLTEPLNKLTLKWSNKHIVVILYRGRVNKKGGYNATTITNVLFRGVYRRDASIMRYFR